MFGSVKRNRVFSAAPGREVRRSLLHSMIAAVVSVPLGSALGSFEIAVGASQLSSGALSLSSIVVTLAVGVPIAGVVVILYGIPLYYVLSNRTALFFGAAPGLLLLAWTHGGLIVLVNGIVIAVIFHAVMRYLAQKEGVPEVQQS